MDEAAITCAIEDIEGAKNVSAQEKWVSPENIVEN